MDHSFSLKKVFMGAFEGFLDNFKIIFIRTLQLVVLTFLTIVFAVILWAFLGGFYLLIGWAAFFLVMMYVIANLYIQYDRGIWKVLHNEPFPSFNTHNYSWASVGLVIVNSAIVLVGLLLFVLPGIYFAIRFSVASYALALENLSVFDSLRRSWRLTRGYSLELFAIFCVTTASKSLFIFSLPINALLNAHAYKQLVELEHASTQIVVK